jgi:hypothetical protein
VNRRATKIEARAAPDLAGRVHAACKKRLVLRCNIGARR